MQIDKDEVVHIGELAKSLNITTRTIRYYEEIGLMGEPERLEGGMRVYRKFAVKRLKFILKLKELGISLKEMRELAGIYKNYRKTENVMPKLLTFLDGHINKIDQKIANLSSLRQDIVEYREQVADALEKQAICNDE